MIVQRMKFPTCEAVGPHVHLSAGQHEGSFWLQVSDGWHIAVAILEPEEWTAWVAELSAVTAKETRAAVVEGRR